MSSASLAFEPPTVVAVFASHAVLCWEQPRTPHAKSFVRHIAWEYQIEYNCSCRARQQPYRTTGSDTFVLLATPHVGETYYVRVVAKSSLAGSTTGLSSAKVAFTASCNVGIPWRCASRPPVCVFDALYLAANVAAGGISALRDARSSTIDHAAELDGEHLCYTLEGDVAVHSYRIVYSDTSALPIGQARTVYYMVATARLHAGRRTCAMELLSMIQHEGASLVFCGVGDSGRLALRAALSFLSFLTTACPALCTSVFCITYGTSRLLLKEGPRLLAHTLPLSGQLLHFTQLPLIDDALPIWDMAALSQRGSGVASDTPPLGYANGFYRNMLLGVQCRVMDGTGLHFSLSSPDQLLTVAEEAEVFDAAGQLRALLGLFFPSSPRWLSPSVASVRCRTEGPLLHVVVEGTNLHYCPRVTLAPSYQRGTALFPRVTASTPLQLECTACLLPWAQQCVADDDLCDAIASGVSAFLLVQTSMGTAFSPGLATVALPEDLLELFRAAQQDSAPWSGEAAPGLVECALQLQPLYALASPDVTISPTAMSNVLHNPLFELLCTLASAAEVVLSPKYADSTAKPGSGMLGLIHSVSARLSSRKADTRADAVPALHVPGIEATLLKNALKEWKGVGFTGIEAWTSRCASWRQRLFYGLPLLRETAYRNTLMRMLHTFDGGAEVGDDAPLACIEAYLYAYTKYHIRAAQPSPVHMDKSLCSELSLSSFYGAVAPIFKTEDSSASGSPLPYLRESMLLWALCHCFELRREVARTTFCCNVGCAGCGVSTLSTSISSLLHREEARRYSRCGTFFRTVQCRVASSRLPAIHLAAQTGVRCCVFLAGEVTDLTRPQYTSMGVRIQEHLTYAGQHLFRVATKADEHLQGSSNLREELASDASVAALMSRMGAEWVGGCGSEVQRLVVALAPSTSRLVELIACSPVEAEQYAQRLRSYSEALLLDCLRFGILRGDANCTKVA
ncbi:hypothetical protein LPMP_231820 [Leishmania panamensis]|uniref:Uncharacterized protein n=1 Tax=Leishmania panamensis TaxID=5679 RepID=A0A088RRV6_LEIPA|nr:hypothetical protein LPMP_231820 [Leishmania panamensis]AIN98630.1 hypothetical protein LPMP_231820 [Leishmania panamensis]